VDSAIAAITDEFLTKKEVLQILHISDRTLQRRRWDGTIKAFAVNSKFYLYPKSSIIDFLAKLESGELKIATFDSPKCRREKQSPKRRRARSSPKVPIKIRRSNEDAPTNKSSLRQPFKA
jgi:hypothetical protein